MREILFRGKQIDNGEWVEGAFLNDRGGAFYICPSVSDISYGDSGNRRRIGCWYKVGQSTVGQFTGLTDKNGKRIFEGDIIKRFWLGSEIIYCVIYDGESARFIGKAMNKSGFTTFDNDGEMFEVIGNIHDNPELLEDFNKEV